MLLLWLRALIPKEIGTFTLAMEIINSFGKNLGDTWTLNNIIDFILSACLAIIIALFFFISRQWSFCSPSPCLYLSLFHSSQDLSLKQKTQLVLPFGQYNHVNTCFRNLDLKKRNLDEKKKFGWNLMYTNLYVNLRQFIWVHQFSIELFADYKSLG